MSRIDDCVAFLQRLIRTRSMPGQEGDIADLVASEMESLGYDEVTRDAAGNVIGLVRGRGDAPSVMFNSPRRCRRRRRCRGPGRLAA